MRSDPDRQEQKQKKSLTLSELASDIARESLRFNIEDSSDA